MKPDRVAPLVVLGTVAAGLLACLPRTPETPGLFLLVAAIPTAGVALVATLLARTRLPAAGISFATTFAAHLALALLIVPDGRWRDVAIMVAMVCCTGAFVIAAPFLLACALARRSDALLAIGGAWSAACQIALYVTGYADGRATAAGAIAAALVTLWALIRMRRSR